LTFCKGQRIGLIAGSGVGKSVLLAMLAKNTAADVVVIGLIGERGREVQEFIQNTLGPEGMQKAIVVAAPVDVSPVSRVRAAKVTHAVAEYFAGLGKDVLILFDSLTRVAHAQREVGLATGEPPTTKGYPPSVFSLLPRLIEKCGVNKNQTGSISAIYTVLAEADDRNDPIVDIARATLDGQIMLSRELADSAHYPAIDLEGSISRVASNVVTKEQNELAMKLRRLWTTYSQNRDLVQVGAYQSGTNLELDEAIGKKSAIDEFLKQDQNDSYTFEESIGRLSQALMA
jgi:flagellum-specific ATP synthase